MDGGPLIRKVLAYITQDVSGEQKLLVFRHIHFPAAGVQVPGGTVDPGEEPEAAVRREVWEESGLCIEGGFRLLFQGVLEAEMEIPVRELFVFHAIAPPGLSENWLHIVSGGEEDTGLHFQFEWMPLALAVAELSGRQGRWLHFLR